MRIKVCTAIRLKTLRSILILTWKSLLLKGLTFITRAGASLGYSRSNTFTGEGSVQWYKGKSNGRWH